MLNSNIKRKKSQSCGIVARVWRHQPGKYFCISIKGRSGKWEDHFFKRGELHRTRRFIAEHRGDHDVYWCPHGFLRRHRRKDCAAKLTLLWADLDEVHPRLVKPKPTVAWRTSDGRYAALWLLTEPVIEDLNRRLTYTIGADSSGWPRTKVLRVPGTTNFKYADRPVVRMLWSDGPEYSRADIEKALSGGPKRPQSGSRSWRNHYRKLTTDVRRAFRGSVKVGKRSDMEWKAIHQLIEAGAPEDEVAAIIFEAQIKPRSNIDQVRPQVRKAIDEAGTRTKKPASPDELAFTNLQAVEPEEYEWVWYPYLAKGEVTIFEGLPGTGKSYVAQIVAGHIATGKPLPTSRVHAVDQSNVLYFDFENDMAKATKPRLLASGLTDLRRIEVCDTPFTIDDEHAWSQIKDRMRQYRPSLVVFDTLNQYIGKADTHRSNEAAQALGGFVELAREYDSAVVVIRHLRKDMSGPAIFAGQGNIALTGTARIVVSFGNVPDEPGLMAMCTTKVNITPHSPALSYRIIDLSDDNSRLQFEGHLELTSEQLIHSRPARAPDIKRAKDLLNRVLADGPCPKQEIDREAAAQGISQRTLRRASEVLPIRKTGNRKMGKTIWSLRRVKGRRRKAKLST